MIPLVIAVLLSSLLGCFITRSYFERKTGRIVQILEKFRVGETIVPDDLTEDFDSRITFLLNQIKINITDISAKEKDEGERVKKMISDISHQLRTPLAKIRMYGELLEKPGLSEDNRTHFLQYIKSETIQSEWLLKNLMNASRLEEGVIAFKAEESGLKDTLSQAVSQTRHLAGEKGILIEMEDFEDCQVWQNRRWTREVFVNILENAIKYSPCHTTIRISAERQIHYMAVSVKDQGKGIPKADLTRIFQRFYRSENVKNDSGSGLGLYLAKLILLKEQGNIIVTSEPGVGSTFTVFLKFEGKEDKQQ